MSLNLYFRALDLATEAHAGQTRKKSGLPYITHPMRVAHLCGIFIDDLRATCPDRLFRGTSPGSLIIPLKAVCLLHDVLEDTEVDEDKIAGLLGCYRATEDIIALVKVLTKGDAECKKTYLERVVKHSPLATSLKMLDRIDNLRDATTTYDMDSLKRYLGGTRTFLSMIDEQWRFITRNSWIYHALTVQFRSALDRVLEA